MMNREQAPVEIADLTNEAVQDTAKAEILDTLDVVNAEIDDSQETKAAAEAVRKDAEEEAKIREQIEHS